MSPDLVSIFLAGLAMDRPFIDAFLKQHREKFPDSTDHLGSPDEIESRILDLWLVTQVMRRTDIRHLVQSQHSWINDQFHLQVYRQLMALGMTETQIMDLQHRLPQRYIEYDEAYAALWRREELSEIKLARVLTRYIFGQETTDVRVAYGIVFSINNYVIACATVFKDQKFNLKPS